MTKNRVMEKQAAAFEKIADTVNENRKSIEKKEAFAERIAANHKKISMLIRRRLNLEEIKILFIEYETGFCYL